MFNLIVWQYLVIILWLVIRTAYIFWNWWYWKLP